MIFEENVESLTRFIAIFHSRLPSVIGPIRSARTSDLNILAAFNRPVLAWSGGNKNVTAVVQVGSELRNRGQCQRTIDRTVLSTRVGPQGAAQPRRRARLRIEALHHPPARRERHGRSTTRTYPLSGANDAGFDLRMDGVRVGWVWDPGSGRYLRQQDGRAHVAADGTQIADAAGAPIPLTSGTTFVELVRAQASVADADECVGHQQAKREPRSGL